MNDEATEATPEERQPWGPPEISELGQLATASASPFAVSDGDVDPGTP